MAPPVSFICVAPEHLRAAIRSGSLTVNEMAWAFCAAVELDGHVWSTLKPPVALEFLRYDWRPYVHSQSEVGPSGSTSTAQPVTAVALGEHSL